MTLRKIININEGLCDGCGNCVTPCAEGAIKIIDGKAKLLDEAVCDGAGFCVGLCPTGALEIIEKDTVDFDEEKAVSQKSAAKDAAVIECFVCGTDEKLRALLPIREKGESKWVCVACLPRLIHG